MTEGLREFDDSIGKCCHCRKLVFKTENWVIPFASPYYDCSQEWDIVIYDGKIPNAERALGRAIYKNGIFEDTNIIQLSHGYKDRIGKWDHLMNGGGVLWHEILHMKCKCDWHSHWDVLREIKGD